MSCYIPHHQYQSNSLYYGYQYANKKRVYQIDDKKFDDCLKDFYTTSKHEIKEIQYFRQRF